MTKDYEKEIAELITKKCDTNKYLGLWDGLDGSGYVTLQCSDK